MRRLEGRVAIITGAVDGIGRGIARRFAADGAKLLIAEIAAEKGRAVADELKREFGAEALAVRTDASDKRAVGAMVEAAVGAFGSVDVLVNNAWGGGTLSRVELRCVMAEHPELESAADAANPMGRIGDPERDIAPVVAFLASDDARYPTGNTLFVDGGAHINGVSWAPLLPD